MGIADPDEAGANPFGTWVRSRVQGGEAWLAWCVRTPDLDGVCARLGLEAQAMSRTRPDGSELRWRVAGVERIADDASLPFFIAWDAPPEELPGRSGGQPQAARLRLAAVEVGVDEDALTEWLGERLGSVRAVAGAPGVHSVAVAGEGGVQVVRPAQ